MKAYVIKNQDGKYLEISVDYEGYDELTFFEDIVYATVFETKEYAEWKIFGTGLKDYTIVPITISEGNLEEENRVLEKALSDIWHSYCCISEVCVDESKLHISSKKAVDKIRSYLGEMYFAFDDIEEKLGLGVDYFIKARKQQAKESEKDG